MKACDCRSLSRAAEHTSMRANWLVAVGIDLSRAQVRDLMRSRREKR